MPVTFSDAEIHDLVAEVKPLPTEVGSRLTMRPKRGHNERAWSVEGVKGAQFVVIVRQSEHNALDFSVILGYRVPKTNAIFRLRRYNGKSHEHTNRLENERFYDFHVHTATERYQDSGFREDAYAERTERYSDLNGAIECLIDDCGFQRQDDNQMQLDLPEGRL